MEFLCRRICACMGAGMHGFVLGRCVDVCVDMCSDMTLFVEPVKQKLDDFLIPQHVLASNNDRFYHPSLISLAFNNDRFINHLIMRFVFSNDNKIARMHTHYMMQPVKQPMK